jgi:hypothetical protein
MGVILPRLPANDESGAHRSAISLPIQSGEKQREAKEGLLVPCADLSLR